MLKYFNECCSCATEGYPCKGGQCAKRRVPHYFCDECGAETKIYEWGEKQLCINCIEGKLEEVG